MVIVKDKRRCPKCDSCIKQKGHIGNGVYLRECVNDDCYFSFTKEYR